MAIRSPEKDSWSGTQLPEVFAPANSNIQSPSHQALDLEEMVVDETILAELKAKKSYEAGRPLFSATELGILEACRSEGATLREAALRIQVLGATDNSGTAGQQLSGPVIRRLRPRRNGLVLIYLIEPKGKAWRPGNRPFVGLAFSFPSSHTAKSVEYKVNKIWQERFPEESDED